MVIFKWPIFAYTTVDLEKFRHGMLLAEIKNAANDVPLFISPSTVRRSTLVLPYTKT